MLVCLYNEGFVDRKVCGKNLFEQVLNIIHLLILPTG